MHYSVWNQGQGRFDYYQDQRVQQELNTPAPTHIRARPMGSTVDQAAWPLPADARLIGHGAVPVGRVAARPGRPAALAGVEGDDVVRAGALLLAGVVAWHVLRPRRGRR